MILRPELVELVIRRRDDHPDAQAVLFAGETVTWSQLSDRMWRAANALLGAGIVPGDRVALCLGNSPDFLAVYLGLVAIGAAPVPVNVAQRGPSLRHILEHSGTVAAVVEAGLDAAIRAAWPEHQLRIIRRGGPDFEPFRSGPVDEPGIDIGGRSPIGILYTSGTTGPPKGVVADGYDLRPAQLLVSLFGMAGGEVTYTCLPLFHGNALMLSFMGAVRNDWVLALGERFSASRFWDEIRSTGAVSFTALGAMIPILLKAPPSRRDRDHAVRVVISAACPDWAWEQFEERFGVRLVEFFGMVDSPGLLINAEGRRGAMGRAVTGVDFRVVDERDVDVADGEIGELVFAHPDGRLTHYHDDQQSTDQAYRGGWFHSGDLARRDADGFFYYCGRQKESMRRRGENISAWEIESVLNQHPDVLECAAFGVVSELGEEEVAVAVVPIDGRGFDPSNVETWCDGQLAAYAIPRFVVIRHALPKTGPHRIQYGALKAEGLTGEVWDRAATANDSTPDVPPAEPQTRSER